MQIVGDLDAQLFCPVLEVASVNEGAESDKKEVAECGDQFCEASTSENQSDPCRLDSIIPQLEAALKSAQLKLANCEKEFAQIDGDEILRPIKERIKQLYQVRENSVSNRRNLR